MEVQSSITDKEISYSLPSFLFFTILFYFTPLHSHVSVSSSRNSSVPMGLPSR